MDRGDLTRTHRYKPRFAFLYLHGPKLEKTLEIGPDLNVVPFVEADGEVKGHYEYYQLQRGQPVEGQIVLPFDILTEPTAVVVRRHEGLKSPQNGLHEAVSQESLALTADLVFETWLVAYMMGIVSRRPIRKFLSTSGASETGGPSRGERTTLFGDLLMWRDPDLYASEWNEEASLRLIDLITRYKGLSEDLRTNLKLPLERINAALDQGHESQRRAIDLGLSLEGLLSEHKEQANGTMLALRGAWLLGKSDAAKRKEVHELITSAYRLRNAAVHAHKTFDHKKAEHLTIRVCELAADLVEDRIVRGAIPIWNKLILGDAS